MSTATKSLSLPDQFKTALDLVTRATAVKAIATVPEYEKARDDYKALIQHEKDLEAQYNELDCVKLAREAQAQKKDLAARFDAAKKYLKNGPMLAYEQAEEEKRKAEERRQQAEAKRLADIETAKQVEAQRQEFLKAEKARKEAEAKAAKAKTESARQEAEEAARQAQERAEQARQEAAAIKADAAAAPEAVVVVEKTTPTVTRGVSKKWRIKTTDGRVFSKDDFQKKTLRLLPEELKGVPAHFFVLEPTAVSGVIDSLGKNHGIPNVEYYEVPK